MAIRPITAVPARVPTKRRLILFGWPPCPGPAAAEICGTLASLLTPPAKAVVDVASLSAAGVRGAKKLFDAGRRM